MKHILALFLCFTTLTANAYEPVYDEQGNVTAPNTIGGWLSFTVEILSIVASGKEYSPPKTEQEYMKEINRKADVLLYDIKTDLMIKDMYK